MACCHDFEPEKTDGILRLHPIYTENKISAFSSAKELWKNKLKGTLMNEQHNWIGAGANFTNVTYLRLSLNQSQT